jgi:Lrp/AsnC family leucine-responsive transcriptional regulator
MQAAPRLRVAELARRIGLSGPAAADRLRRLEESGTLSYQAESTRALGYTLFAIVRISPSGGGLRLIPGIAREVPNVTECYRITGEDCFFMKVYLGSIDDPEPILDLLAGAQRNMECKVATPSAVERTSRTIDPLAGSTVQVAHEQHSVSTATRARSSSSVPGPGRKLRRRPSAVSARSVSARAISCAQRVLWAARSAELSVQATGVLSVMTVPPGKGRLVTSQRRC